MTGFLFIIILLIGIALWAVYMGYIDLDAVINKLRFEKELPPQDEDNPLKCKVSFADKDKEKDKLLVEIKGLVKSPYKKSFVSAVVTMFDVTDSYKRKKIVQSSTGAFQCEKSPEFSFEKDLGKLTCNELVIENWMKVANINTQFIRPARKGTRKLELVLTIFSKEKSKVIARSCCYFDFENENPGYIDLQDNIQKAKSIAITLGFAVSAADGKLYKCQIDTIKKWAHNNFEYTDNDKTKMEKAMDKIVSFFQNGNTLDIRKICWDLVEIAPLPMRYEILELCLKVARSNGTAFKEEIEMLKNLGSWLQVDPLKFHDMVEKHLPVNIHEVEDMEFILGISETMTEDQKRKLITQEYHKWNSRVTNFDDEVKSQADHMLELIAQARTLYVK